MSAEGGPEGLPGDRLQADGGLGLQPRWGSPASEQPGRAWALLCWHCFQKFPVSPAQEHLADKSVLKVCHCQKYQEEFNVLSEKA